MNNKRRIAFRLGTLIILIGIAACMMIIGRGHTVYLDNKKLEYQGETYDPPYKVTILVNGEQVAKLNARERGMATNIGQNFEMTLKIVEEKGGEEIEATYRIHLPYSLDGIVINLPGYLEELPQEAWLSEFVSLATDTGDEEDIPETDEFEMGDF